VIPPRSDANGKAAWQIFGQDDEKFEGTSAPFMINYVVEDLRALIAVLKEEGCQVADEVQDYAEYGLFAWVMDPEGNKVELWQP
jgi:predicted enzyme related to lactoylglutathione lyase